MYQPAAQPTYHNPRRSRRLLLGLAATVVLAVVAAAVLLTTDVFEPVVGVGRASFDAPSTREEARSTVPEPTSFSSVAMVGDSITAGSTDELRYTLVSQGFTDITIDGVNSRRIDIGNGSGAPMSGIRTLFQLLAAGTAPDVWVVALGTNDVGQYGTDEEYAALIDIVVGMLPADVPLVWVDVYRPQYPDDTSAFNELVRERLDDRGNAVLASWFDAASRPDQRVLRADDIHPNDDGAAVFAAIVADAIAELG